MSDDVTPRRYVEQKTVPPRPEKMPFPRAQVSKGVPGTYRKTSETTIPGLTRDPNAPKREKTPPVPRAECEHPLGALQRIGPHDAMTMYCGRCESDLTSGEQRNAEARLRAERQRRAEESSGPDSGNPQKPYRNQ